MFAAGPDDDASPTGAIPDSSTLENSVPETSLREDQIQNAVAFLSHPKVRGSAVSAKRSFLEKKGLTNAEIDEAFKRVPEAPTAAPASTPAPAAPAPAATSSTPAYGANNLVTYTQQQQQQQQPGLLMQAPVAQPGHVALMPLPPQNQALLLQQQQQPLKWTHVLFGLGVAAASLYGVHQLLAPRLSTWSHQLFSARRAAAEAEAARSAALTATLERLAAGQERLQESLDSLAGALQQQQQQAQVLDRSGGSEYLRCQSPSLVVRGGQQAPSTGRPWDSSCAHDTSRAATLRGADTADSTSSSHPYFRSSNRPGQGSSGPGGFGDGGFRLGGPGGAPDGFEVVPHSPGHALALSSSSAVRAGGARGCSGVPTAGPAGDSSNSPYVQSSSPYAHSSSGSRPGTSGQQAAVNRPEEAPHSAAFHEVMEMVRAGITPPNVRTDIDDSPPDPSRPISAPQLQPRGKPWERQGSSSISSNIDQQFGGLSAAAAGSYQQQQQHGSPSSFAMNETLQTTTTIASLTSYQQEPTGAGVMRAMEAAAVTAQESSRRAAGYDLSHLLGTEGDAPWRPPPPPPRTVQPAAAATATATGTVVVSQAGAAVPKAAAGSAEGMAAAAEGPPPVSDEEVVAGIAASVIQNVVASAEATAEAAA